MTQVVKQNDVPFAGTVRSLIKSGDISTGRTHQIRVHLSHAGHSVVGAVNTAAANNVWSRSTASHVGANMLGLIVRRFMPNITFVIRYQTEHFSCAPPPDLEALLDLCRTET
jgi:hypothetical protein